MKWLEDASPDSLREALISIARAQNIPEDEVRAYVEGKPDKDTLALAQLLHALFCERRHILRLATINERDPETGLCGYDMEEQVVSDERWQMEHHVKWLGKAKALCELFPDTSACTLKAALSEMYKVLQFPAKGDEMPIVAAIAIVISEKRTQIDKLVEVLSDKSPSPERSCAHLTDL